MLAYSQLSMRGGSGVRPKEQPQTLAYLMQAGLTAEEPSPSSDLELWFHSQEQPDPLPLLCLRCRLSGPLHQWILAKQRKHGQQHPLELSAMAAYLLDDDGSLQIALGTADRQGSGRPRQPFTHAAISSSQEQALHPFTAEVLRSWDPRRASLPHWGRERAQSHPPLKAYFRECGLLLISDWALLADTSPTRVQAVWSRFGVGTLSPEQAVDLHGRYLPLYRDAKARHRQLRGKASGWEPDAAFLQELEPEQPVNETCQQLQAIARAIRLLLSGSWQVSSGEDLEQASDGAQVRGLLDPGDSDDEAGSSTSELLELIRAALQRAMDHLLPAEVAKEQKRFSTAADKRLAWQLYGEGLSQREIAARCDHQQAWVSKLLDEKRRSAMVATAAAAELLQQPAFQACGSDPAALVRLQEALRNHLVEPEQEGGVAPLRLWIQRALQTP